MVSIELPDPAIDESGDIEGTIASRVSRREYAAAPVSIEKVSLLLWASQGVTHVTDDVEMRASPSAGATYPLETFLEVTPDGCDDLTAGLYRYVPAKHGLETVLETDIHGDVVEAALDQRVVRDAPATVALAADYSRTVSQYPDHGRRYVHMEAGHAAQNVQLVCESRGLSNCPVGAFDDEQLAAALDLADDLDPLYLLPFGPRPE